MSKPELNDGWTDVVADTKATAEEYRDRGWDALAVSSGDANPVPEDARLDVLVPGPEFDEIRGLMDDVEIDGFRVFAARQGDVEYRLVAAEDGDAEFALCVPTFVFDHEVDGLRAAADEAGRLTLRLRPMDDRDVVDVVLVDPGLFFESEPA